MDPYIYTPITKAGNIRIIKLHPSTDKSAPIECSLVHTTLTYFQENIIDHYTALSYVWGDPGDRVDISVDGKSLAITRSLETALQHFRDGRRAFDVWADGICIDQSNDDEKLVQVQQMGVIYESAAHTIIFLGAATEASDLWFKAMERLPKDLTQSGGDDEGLYSNSQKDGQGFWDALRIFLDAGSTPTDSESKNFIDTLMEALQQVLVRSWFQRVWVFQELVLSRDPRVQCGDFRYTWHHFYTAAFYVTTAFERQQHIITHYSDPGCTDEAPHDGQSTSLITSKDFDTLHSMYEARNEYVKNMLPLENDKEDEYDNRQQRIRMFDDGHTDAGQAFPNTSGRRFDKEELQLEAVSRVANILQSRRGLGVCDPRDMFFAHFGLIKFAGQDILKYTTFDFNYGQNTAEIYNKFARKHIEITQSLDLITASEDRNLDHLGVSGLRSWAPDWTATSTHSLWNLRDRKGREKGNLWRRPAHETLDWSMPEGYSWTRFSELFCSIGIISSRALNVGPLIPQISLTSAKHQKVVPNFDNSWESFQRWSGFEFVESILTKSVTDLPKFYKAMTGRRIATFKDLGGDWIISVPARTNPDDKICLTVFHHSCYLIIVREVRFVPEAVVQEVQNMTKPPAWKPDMTTKHYKIVGACAVERNYWDYFLFNFQPPFEDHAWIVFH